MCESVFVRLFGIAASAAMAVGLLAAPPAVAGPQTCNEPSCVPGITPNVVLGSYCSNTSYYVFGTAVAGPSIRQGRLVFCGSARRYEPRWFRSPPLAGIRDENSDCSGYNHGAAQAPDGLFLMCVPMNGRNLWRRGDA